MSGFLPRHGRIDAECRGEERSIARVRFGRHPAHESKRHERFDLDRQRNERSAVHGQQPPGAFEADDADGEVLVPEDLENGPVATEPPSVETIVAESGQR